MAESDVHTPRVQTREPRPVAAAVMFIVGAVISGYWIWLLGREAVSGRADLGIIGPLLTGATQTYLPVLAGIGFLDLAPERFRRWRLPGAVGFAVLAIVMSVGAAGVYPAIAAMVLTRRARHCGARGWPVTALWVAVWVVLVFSVIWTLLGVGLCGPRVLVGFCDA